LRLAIVGCTKSLSNEPDDGDDRTQQADLGGARMQLLRSARGTTATRHETSAWSALPMMVFAAVCETYKERHALVVGKRRFCCGSND
jgi:hypothetical protein